MLQNRFTNTLLVHLACSIRIWCIFVRIQFSVNAIMVQLVLFVLQLTFQWNSSCMPCNSHSGYPCDLQHSHLLERWSLQWSKRNLSCLLCYLWISNRCLHCYILCALTFILLSQYWHWIMQTSTPPNHPQTHKSRCPPSESQRCIYIRQEEAKRLGTHKFNEKYSLDFSCVCMRLDILREDLLWTVNQLLWRSIEI